ncbi:hypothetical protein CBR_g19818 [Chara braunii]|uniref:Protein DETOXIFICATION n=1 Tax=Chara braunii TaxID=69332 RepID=A0A388JU16_CHABU|nr:hypothetical protein CBR_g19818 [Chara braunii]|eukprot:GBG61285.1 hypothetical protein CBR_g19818 [Chara braunii]
MAIANNDSLVVSAAPRLSAGPGADLCGIDGRANVRSGLMGEGHRLRTGEEDGEREEEDAPAMAIGIGMTKNDAAVLSAAPPLSAGQGADLCRSDGCANGCSGLMRERRHLQTGEEDGEKDEEAAPAMVKGEEVLLCAAPPPSRSDLTATGTDVGGREWRSELYRQAPPPSRGDLTATGTDVRGREWGSELCQQVHLAAPIIVMNLLWQSRFPIASLFLGRLGTVKLAGGGLAMVLANLTGFCMLNGMSVGIEILCGKAYGARKFGELSLTLQRGLLILLAVCMSTACFWVILPRLLAATGQDPAVVAVTAQFLTFLVPDLVASAGVNALAAFLRSQSITQPIMISTALALVVQTAGGWVAIHVLDLGIAGVAMSLFLSDMTILLSLLVVIWLWYTSSWTGFSRDCFSNLRPLLSLSLPACFAIALEWWSYEFMGVISGLLPDPAVSLASMSIAENISYMYFMVPSGMYLAVSIRMTNELGAHRADRARLCAKVGAYLAAAGGLLGLCTMILCRGIWAPLFTDDPEILRTVDDTLVFVGLCSLVESPASMAAAVARCTGHQTAPAVSVIPSYAVGVTAGLCLAFHVFSGLTGLWTGLAIGQTLNFLLLWVFVLRSLNWEEAAGGARWEARTPGGICQEEEGEGEGEGEGYQLPSSKQSRGGRPKTKMAAHSRHDLPGCSPPKSCYGNQGRDLASSTRYQKARSAAAAASSEPSLTEPLLPCHGDRRHKEEGYHGDHHEDDSSVFSEVL